jgi:hypothetical protein
MSRYIVSNVPNVIWNKQKNLLLLSSILLHAALDPIAALGSELIHFILVFEKLFDSVRVRYVTALFNTRAACHALFPGF